MSDHGIVEPLLCDQAWEWSGKSVRLTIQVRPRDMSVMYALMEGTGAKPATFARHTFQTGLDTKIRANGLKCEGGLLVPENTP